MKITDVEVLDFMRSVSRDPDENYAAKGISDSDIYSLAYIENKISNRELSGYAVNSEDVHVVAFVASLLGWEASLGVIAKYTNKDEKDRLKYRRFGAELMSDIFIECVQRDYSDFDECWDAIKESMVKVHEMYQKYNEPYFTVGRAQKWTTMANKYFYCLCRLSKKDNIKKLADSSWFKYSPFPVDDFMQKYVKLPECGVDVHWDSKEFGGAKGKFGWGNVTDLTRFENYERAIFNKIKESDEYDSLLEFEFRVWPEAAKLKGMRFTRPNKKKPSETVESNELDKRVDMVNQTRK